MRIEWQIPTFTAFGGEERFLKQKTLLKEQQEVELSQGLGTHCVTSWIGLPTPQRVTLIVDTGSTYAAFACDECFDCGEEYHTDKYFHPNLSTTCQLLTTCRVHILVQDTFSCS